MEPGIALRMSRLFSAQTGKSLVIAIDHGIEGLPNGLEDPLAKVTSLASGVDASTKPRLVPEGSWALETRSGPGVVLADYFGKDCSWQDR